MTKKKNQRGHKFNKKAIHRLMFGIGMTLVEMLCFMVLIPCMLIGALLANAMIGSWYGWLIGAALGFLVFFVFLMGLALLQESWSGQGRLPKCRNGCCRGPGHFSFDSDYDWQKFGEEYYNVCKCGDRYKRRGRRFVLINADGTETSYLIWRRFRGWCPDEGDGK